MFLFVMRCSHATEAQEVAAALNASAVARMAAIAAVSSDSVQQTVRVENVWVMQQAYHVSNVRATLGSSRSSRALLPALKLPGFRA